MARPDHDDRRSLISIKPTNLLSFGPDTEPLELKSLNVLIGPNGAGKSNLIEALSLIRATPAPQAASNTDLRGVIRRGGGVHEWIWKGSKNAVASIDLVISNPRGRQPLRHLLSFRGDDQGFLFEDERIENESPNSQGPDVDFYYRFQGGNPVVNTPMEKGRKLARETVNADLSILSQRRDPELYPEITHLAETYETWRIYREWAFGRNTVYRVPQRTDMRSDRLDEDFSNLALFLNRLRRTPAAKSAILDALHDLYDEFSDFDISVHENTLQVFVTEGEFTIPATRLSDGTLRYLCLLAILCDPAPPPLICIEEPELGLHPDILPKLADLLIAASARTQIIVTTHSDILVDAMTDVPEFVVICEKHKGQTEMNRLKEEELRIWLAKYRLGQLWLKGQIGGTRW